MNNIRKLEVLYNEVKVGTLATMDRHLVAFEYDDQWLVDGFSISPYSLPLQKKIFTPKMDPFDGIFGVFADSLPDGWGRLLVDRLMLKQGMNPLSVGNLNRLAVVGTSGMGALSYVPVTQLDLPVTPVDLDEIAEECASLLKKDYTDKLDELFLLGGSSGGARPKILMDIEGEEWIIKFPSSQDSADIGIQEYRYSQCAKACGIKMTETRLFSSKVCKGYFGTKRFDRAVDGEGNIKKYHMISVSALLETTHRIPNLDYNILMKLTLQLTNDYKQVEALFRQMCFNVFAHNRDDHSKNFTFIYDEKKEGWVLSPAYDLTYSYSLQGEHATTVNGNGVDPGMKEILIVAEKIGIKSNDARRIANDIEDCVRSFHLF